MSLTGIGLILRSLREHGVRGLLSGGQACVIYGGAEFTKDVDFVVVSDPENFERIQAAARTLQAETIAVPPFERQFLEEGLAIHLRCRTAGCDGLRLDLMSRMRGMDDFPALWMRRTSVELSGLKLDLLGMRDLIRSKKTQRAKDWPMIQRLVEAHYQARREKPSSEDVHLWLGEMLTAEVLMQVVARYPREAEAASTDRKLLEIAISGNLEGVRQAIIEEMEVEKALDRRYWEPLKARLSELRRNSRP